MPGADYLSVFRLVGFAAFMGYALALPQASIWYRRNWRVTLVKMFDGLVYAGLTGGVFGWLWPDRPRSAARPPRSLSQRPHPLAALVSGRRPAHSFRLPPGQPARVGTQITSKTI